MNKKFLIIGSKNYANRRILYEFEQKGFEATILDRKKLLPFINDKEKDRMYVSTDDSDEPTRIYKKSLSAIVPRIGKDLQFFSKSVEHLQNNIGIPTTATTDGLLNAQDKIRSIQLLSQNGIKTPKTFAIKETGSNFLWIVDKLGGFPIVAKLIYGSQGIGVFILTELLSASTALDAFTSQGHSLLLQQFIETAKDDDSKSDYRAVVVDGKVVAAIKRNSVGKDFRTNTSLKEDCEGVELDNEMKEIAIKAAKAVNLDCAGVDLAKDYETGEIYCYEVNGNFNFKSTEKFSKKNVAKSIVEYAMKISKSVEDPDKLNSWDKNWYARTDPKFLKEVKDVEKFDTKPLSKKSEGIPFLDFTDDDENENDDFEFSSFGKSKYGIRKGEFFIHR